MNTHNNSNVIIVDFKANKKDHGIKPFSQLLNQIIPEGDLDDESLIDELINDWSEDLSLQDRHEQLKDDIDFLLQMNKC